MPYDLTITDVKTNETLKTTIKELKELRDILKQYETKTISVELINQEKVKKKV